MEKQWRLCGVFHSIETRCAVFTTFTAGTKCQVQDPSIRRPPRPSVKPDQPLEVHGGAGGRIPLKGLAGDPGCPEGWPVASCFALPPGALSFLLH